MVGVSGGLGACTVLNDILESVRVETKLVGEVAEQNAAGVAQVDPYESALGMQILRNIVQREVFGLQLTAGPQPATNGRGARPGNRGRHVGTTAIT